MVVLELWGLLQWLPVQRTCTDSTPQHSRAIFGSPWLASREEFQVSVLELWRLQ